MLESSGQLDIEVEVNLEKHTFDLRCRVKSRRQERQDHPLSQVVKDVPLEKEGKGNWNFLLLHFTKKQTVEIVLKNASEPHQSVEMSIKEHLPEKGSYQMALGNNCRTIIS